MAANGLSGTGGWELRGRDVIAGLEAAVILQFSPRGDPDDRGDIGQADFAGEAAIPIEPTNFVGDGDAALLNAPMTFVYVYGRFEAGGRSMGEKALDFGSQGRLIGFYGEQIVGVCISDRGRNGRVCRNRVDWDQGPLEALIRGEPLDQRRDGGDLVGARSNRLLPDN
jgi:hypothetical protein